MKFKTAELNLHPDSNAPDVSLDEANDIDLYDDLLAFTDLSPEEQKAAMNRPILVNPSQQSPVEIPETNAVYEQQAVEPVAEPSQAKPFDKDSSTDFQLAEILRVTGQLSDLSTKHDWLSVCVDCGSPADSEDVFCCNCGGSLEEIERAASLSCSDCGEMIVSDEIFCPSCGSAIFGA
ncbi:MAG TPA: zinc ribbon domain-containing protein [Blastocatellia bacterium]|nr:zinc ribbon domain-containing protein [Blastocatellia bacterium]